MLDRVVEVVDVVARALIAVLFFAIVIVGGMQVFNRFVLNQSLSWSEEFMVYANVWMVFLAVPVGYKRGSHIGMDLFVKRLPAGPHQVMALAIDCLWLVLATAIVFYTTVIMGVARNQFSPAMDVRMDRIYLGLVVGWSYMMLLAIRKIAGGIGRLRTISAGGA
jgi:TRAP-type C4-dicarboxylate transport system permease small subunit